MRSSSNRPPSATTRSATGWMAESTAVTSTASTASTPLQRRPASVRNKSSISNAQAAALRKISGVA